MDEVAANLQTTTLSVNWLLKISEFRHFPFHLFNSGLLDEKPSSVKLMAWQQTGDMSFPKPIMVQFSDDVSNLWPPFLRILTSQ